jgi:hypothetical protein
MQTQPQPTIPPPGWYPDPHGAPHMRWWDGAQWTAHVGPPAAAGDDGLRHVVPIGRPASAIAAGYLALFAVIPVFIFGIGAVICGLVALNTLKRRPDLIGRGRALFGIIFGGGVTLLWFLLFVASVSSSPS